MDLQIALLNYVIPKQVKEGEVADFVCKVTGDPTPELVWYFNGQHLEGVGRYSVVEREELQVLEITDIVPGDQGEYKVLASNPFGEVSCTANLEVEGKICDSVIGSVGSMILECYMHGLLLYSFCLESFAYARFPS